MKLCLELIEDVLGLGGELYNHGAAQSKYSLEHSEILVSNSPLQNGVLYLAYGADLPDDPRRLLAAVSANPTIGISHTALICIGTPPATYKTSGLPLLVLDEVTDLVGLINAINQVFYEYQELETRIHAAIREHRSVQDMVMLVAPYFKNELIVMNADFRLVGQSNEIVAMYELSGIPQPDARGVLPAEYVNYFKNDILYGSAKNNREPFMYEPGILLCRVICENVFYNDEFACQIIVAESDRPFKGYEEGLLRMFAGHIQFIYERLGGEGLIVPKDRLVELFGRIIKSERINEDELDACLQQKDWGTDKTFVCLSIMPSAYDFYNRTISYFCHLINQKYKGCCAFETSERIVCIVDLAPYQGSEDRFMHAYIEDMRDSYFKVGLSNCFHDLKELKAYYTQAEIALQTGLERYPIFWYHKFNERVIAYLKDALVRDLDATHLCAPQIVKLQEYDRKNASEYLRTLKAYFDNRMNAVQAAKELFIHHATIVYRLGRIKEIANIDFDDPEALFYYQISLQLLLEEDSSIAESLPAASENMSAAPENIL